MPDLFVKSQQQETLRDFARRMAKLLNLPDLECRESSNYVDGEYFRCVTLALDLTFARSDQRNLDEYPFWIVLQPDGVRVKDQSFLEDLADLLARRLSIAGEHVVRIRDAWSKERAKGIFYTHNAGASRFSDDEVVIVTE